MSNTTFSNMSNPDLDITLAAYNALKFQLNLRLAIVEMRPLTSEKEQHIRKRLIRLNELIEAVTLMKGCIDQLLNG